MIIDKEKFEQKVITEQLIFQCLGKCEQVISKAAYNKIKWKNSRYVGQYDCEINLWGEKRKKLRSLLYHKYSLSEIQQILNQTKYSNIGVDAVDQVIALIDSGDYKVEMESCC